jgi:3-phenylpropionate/trans-cinnamate dioxygenase ferredoxin reductase subunit
MPHYTYLIVGGGMTAAAAVAGIREGDHDGTIGVIGSEAHPPYDRPPLSKTLWKGDALDSIWRSVDGSGATSHSGRTVRNVDPKKREIVDDQGTSYTYDKLLLATGCSPRRLPFANEQILYFRTVDDYERLRALTKQGTRFAIIGGGFIGSELAASLVSIGKSVVMVFPGAGIGSRMYPPDLSSYLTGLYREKGVEVLAGATATACGLRDGKPVLTVSMGQDGVEREVAVDGVVAGIGAEPNVELAHAAGLIVDHGIRVDASLCTSDPKIYAAGDVASFHDPSLNVWRRVEHADNATTMGGYAGVAMAGRPVSYNHLPFFYSDFFDLGYEAVGELDVRLQMVADWKVPFREGVVYYLRDGRVRGVLLWNVWGQLDAARQLIGSRDTFRAEELTGRLPE